MSSALKIVFAGTPEFAAVSLGALLESDHKVCAVYTQPDRPAGRGRKLTASPVKQLALEHELPVYQPKTLKDFDEQQTLKSLRPDILVVVAYGLILPPEILSIPRYGCFNVHASLLPRWRGAAPIQRAIMAGDEETGVTIMQMDVGLDTGDMLMRVPTPILPEDTGELLHDRLAALGAHTLLLSLTELQLERLQPSQQDDSQANYAAKLDKSEATIDWGQSTLTIWNKVRAFIPWPVAQSEIDNKKIRIWAAYCLDGQGPDEQAGKSIDSDIVFGTVIQESKQGIDVKTGDGVLRITQLQLPGKKPMSSADFINAHSLVGKTFNPL